MTTTNKPRSAAGAPGVKALLATLSLAATVGGWAWLTARPVQNSQSAPATDAQIAALNLPALPTVVPPPANFGGGVLTNTSGQAVNPAPQPPILRSITLPSFPLFSTRSSR